MKTVLSHKIFWLIAALLLSIAFDNPAVGLIAGAGIAMVFGNPVSVSTGGISKKLLQISVTLLGFGLQIGIILKVGLASIGITLSGIAVTLAAGLLLCRVFGIDGKLSVLLTSGTAICGGSAIAAMSPAINASHSQTAMAMSVVFLLNALGLVIFPPLGHALNMSQESFGLWSAVAIHDTSSVVGAASAYGAAAAGIAVTVKLTRALWIFPLAFAAARFNKSETKPPFQWFLVTFLLAGVINSLFPERADVWNFLALSGRHLMTGALFLVGSCLTLAELRKIGVKPLIVSVILWVFVSAASFLAIKFGLWHISADILN